VISSGSAMRGIAKFLTAPAPAAAASDPATIGVRTLLGLREAASDRDRLAGHPAGGHGR
jgi:hypothetical protein